MSHMRYKADKYRTGEKALTRKEYEKLLTTIDNLEDEVMIQTAIATGIRREDLCSIKISDIDFNENKISFYESKKKRIWNVYTPDELVRKIKQLIQSRGKKQSEYLITYSGRTAYRRLQEYCDRAGIDRRPFHSLRATCIKFCQSAGWTPEQVSRHTGDTISVIQRHYSTPSTSEMYETAREKEFL